jgi:hypothetical protein
MNTNEGAVVVSPEQLEEYRIFLAELQYWFGDLSQVPWMVA